MNKERVQELIDVITLHKKVDMEKWLSYNGTCPPKDNEDFHTCGNSACIAGFMHLTPSFKAMGGVSLYIDGEPAMLGSDDVYLTGAESFAVFTGVGKKLAKLIATGEGTSFDLLEWCDWDWQDAVCVLENLERLDSMSNEEAHDWLNQLEDPCYD